MNEIDQPFIKYYWGVVPSMAYSSEWFRMNVQTDSTNGLSESLKSKAGEKENVVKLGGDMLRGA